jgi:DHA1 family bicyclomycin/chloramphenicol resistance-like MFS transporter
MVAIFTNEITLLLVTRVTMGIGASTARVVAMAIVRDQTSGREMARLISLIMMVFALVPAIAPSIGAVIVGFTGWRGLFAAFAVFSISTSLWFLIRQPETLTNKRALAFAPLMAALEEMVSLSVVRRSIMIQTLIYAGLFAALSSTQQVFADVYGQVSQFPYWFALIAVLAASASFLNSKIVVKLGMQRVISTALLGQIAISAVMIAIWLWSSENSFGIYVIWTTSVFFVAGLTLGNLNALAMEPLGHIAGFAASLLQGTATVGSALIAAPIGLAFDGTPLPVAIGITACITLAYMITRSSQT